MQVVLDMDAKISSIITGVYFIKKFHGSFTLLLASIAVSKAITKNDIQVAQAAPIAP